MSETQTTLEITNFKRDGASIQVTVSFPTVTRVECIQVCTQDTHQQVEEYKDQVYQPGVHTLTLSLSRALVSQVTSVVLKVAHAPISLLDIMQHLHALREDLRNIAGQVRAIEKMAIVDLEEVLEERRMYYDKLVEAEDYIEELEKARGRF